MSVTDLLTRVDVICRRYEKYDADKQRELNVAGDDAFARLFAAFESDADAAFQKSEAAKTEKRRATVVATNAEIRRTKARLLEDLPKLQRLAFKKVKGIPKEVLEGRSELVAALKDRIEAIPDGTAGASSQNRSSTASSLHNTGIKFDSTSGGRYDGEYYRPTGESDRFRQEYEMKRMNQDEGLDVIAEGLDTLKDLAAGINEELDRQEPLMDEIDDKVDRAATEMRSTNRRLKDTVVQLRSSRNFCLDIILLSVILGIAAYLYNVLK
ncbi:hypothetical protein MLD38_018273 [Melastoma candidum]|uniref:Uncharacterized protein n=1 Tax=Melastoma candidum TaxID=119954 RepID=A0ACB9QWG4_9MYRT|nr:hypothetical protein MLD38_018273 [Melastoma candidum]